MTRKLIDKLTFREYDVFLSGENIFSVPLKNSRGIINLLGVPKGKKAIYVGSGGCCFGPISILEKVSNNRKVPDFRLINMIFPNFNVHDVIPAVVDDKKTHFTNKNTAMLVTGHGCAGSGVRLVDTHYPNIIDIVSSNEYYKKFGCRWAMPRFNIDKQKGSISLNLLVAGYVDRLCKYHEIEPRKSRDPTKLPSDLGVDSAIKQNSLDFRVLQEIYASMDLTCILNEIGVDVEKTIKANDRYENVYSKNF